MTDALLVDVVSTGEKNKKLTLGAVIVNSY